mgnify:CR=1 FL=1
MRAFSLDPESGIPVKLQLKAHIRYQITTGMLRPGDQLPPLRDLAAGLGIHLNTVVRAVNELTTEGYLYSHPGRGVFVADEFPGQEHGAALRSLLAGVLQQAQEWGLSAEEMALAMLAHGQLAKPFRPSGRTVLLVGGSHPQLRRLQAVLEAALDAQVIPALVEEAPERARGRTLAAAAVTLFHAAETQRLLPDTLVVPLANTEARSRFAALKRLPAGSAVVVASRDWVHAARICRSLEVSGLGGLRLEVAVGATPSAFQGPVQGAKAVLAAPDCRELVREALNGDPHGLLLSEPVEPPPEALAALRKAVGTPTRQRPVQVRSSWV